MMKNEADLLANIKNMQNKKELIEESATKKEEKKTKKKTKTKISSPKITKKSLGFVKRTRKCDVLDVKIDEEKDDLLIRLIKEKIIEKSITMGYVYDKVQNNSNAYNMIYGLFVRHSMSWKIFEEWCKVLNVDVYINISDKI